MLYQTGPKDLNIQKIFRTIITHTHRETPSKDKFV